MNGLDLRSPYTAAEWEVASAALRAEKERRHRRGEPFPQADQARAVREAVRPLRETVQGALKLTGGGS
jgi:hypothetical protein